MQSFYSVAFVELSLFQVDVVVHHALEEPQLQRKYIVYRKHLYVVEAI
jgi:hypothetical protein